MYCHLPIYDRVPLKSRIRTIVYICVYVDISIFTAGISAVRLLLIGPQTPLRHRQ
jgi:hypothetical protein